MQKYSIPRQIWRAIYPPLIFVGISFVVVIAAIVVAFVGLLLQHGINADANVVITELVAFVLEHVLVLTLISNVISTLIFAMMWRKIRLTLPKYENAKLKPLTVGLIAFLFAGFNLLLVWLFEISNIIQYFPSYLEVDEILSGGSFFVRIVSIVIVAPIVEELLCRGIVLNRLLSWTHKWVAILVSSALFGLLHFNLLQGLYAFVIGVAFSVVYLRYRNLWIPIIGHMAFNLISVVLDEIIEVTGVQIDVWILMVSGALVTAACIVLLGKCTKVAVLAETPNAAFEQVPVERQM